jgi:hypothetical protein
VASLRDLDTDLAPVARAFVRIIESPMFAAFAGVPQVRVTVTSTRRGPDKQRALWDCYRRTGCANCRRTPNCFPAAPPGKSTHALGIAFDLKLVPAVYAKAGQLWEALGFTWGGRFNDPIHFDARRR